ncbi:MAG TPA: methionyl-tRNA formyltransferase, partial [Vicingus sp.]|nr:methionyl-tRNA formyltransferase [Vicingus sp.]
NQELKEAFKIFKPDCKIDWNLPIDIIHNKVRGLSPYPTAWTTLMNKENKELLSLKIFKTLPVFENHQLEPKTIISTKNTIKIAVHGGYIEIVELQLEGKKRMDVPALLNGFNINQYQLID